MFKWNILLVIVLVACALGVVASQNKARKIFLALENEKKIAQRIEDEWGRLQIEQSTLVMHERIERKATEELGMRVPSAAQVQIISAKKINDLPNMDGMLKP